MVGNLDTLNVVYFVLAMLLFVSVVGSTLSARLGMPLLLLFLLVGMAAGEEGVLGIAFEEFFFANLIGQAALAVILLDGGLRTSVQSFRVALKPAVLLATYGVLATAGLLGLFVAWILAVDWRLGMLMAAIVGSTDAAAVFSLLRNGGVRLNERVQSTLELESGANDPMAILLVSGFIALNLDPESKSFLDFVWLLVSQLGLGLLIGLVCGLALASLLPRVRLADGMYAILIFSGGLMVFAATNMLNGSGFLAIFISGLIIGNLRTRATEHVLSVMDGMAWLAQAVLFVMLGLLVTPSRVLELWSVALAIFVFLTFVARPVAVASGLSAFGYGAREVAFVSWVGLRGAVPITLAIMPVMMGVENARLLFDLAFAVVCLSLIVQGTTIPLMARWFQVKVPTLYEPNDEHEIWVGKQSSIFVYEFIVRHDAVAVGVNPEKIARRIGADEVRLFAVVREGRLLPITEQTVLRAEDSVWYTLLGDHALALARIFNDTVVQRQKKTEFFGEWVVSPQVLIGELAPLDKQALSLEVCEQRVIEFLLDNLGIEPVLGDSVTLTPDWQLVVREITDEGEVTLVGLKFDYQGALEVENEC